MTFIGFKETSSYWSVQFVQFFIFAFDWSPLVNKPRMTLVSFFKINISYDMVEAETRKSQASFQII